MDQRDVTQAIGRVQAHLIDAGSGPAVLMVHGSQAWAYAWRFQIPVLADAGYRAIAVDLPGEGYSQADETFDYSIPGMSDFLSQVLDHFNLPSAVLMASSAGGLPVLDFAIRHPERIDGLVLASTCGVSHRLPLLWRMARVPALGEAMGWFLSEGIVRQNLREAMVDPNSFDEKDVKAYYQPLTRPEAWKTNLKIERSWDPSFVEENISRIRCPALIVWGEKDPWHPVDMAQEFARRLQRADVKILPGCGHLPHEEQPQEFNRLLLAFLSERIPMIGKQTDGSGIYQHAI